MSTKVTLVKTMVTKQYHIPALLTTFYHEYVNIGEIQIHNFVTLKEDEWEKFIKWSKK